MNHDFLIRQTNRIAVYATAALIYWAFVFLLITVFDLKIFRERMTETFVFSLLGIFAVLGGAIVLNVMSNLSKISAAVSGKNLLSDTTDTKPTVSPSWRWQTIAAALSFPLIAAALFAGDLLSAERKKDLLVSSARKLVAENQNGLAALADYQFGNEYVVKAYNTMDVIKKIDNRLPEVMIIFPDEIAGKKVFMAFGANRYIDENKPLDKSAFIYSASQDEREYLAGIFASKEVTTKFHAEKGNYQLYFPTLVSGKKIVLYFSDRQRYGKFGS